MFVRTFINETRVKKLFTGFKEMLVLREDFALQPRMPRAVLAGRRLAEREGAALALVIAGGQMCVGSIT